MRARTYVACILSGVLLAGVLPTAWGQPAAPSAAAPSPGVPVADAQPLTADSLPPSPASAPGPVAAPAGPTIAELLRRIQALEASNPQRFVPLAAPKPTREPQTATFEARWSNAFMLQSTDERFRLRVGVLVQADGRLFIERSDPPPVDSPNQFLLRTARTDLEADVWHYFSIRIQPDLAGGRLALLYTYADVKPLPELRFRFGKFKVPFGLERWQPDYTTLFAERALPTEISPNRDLGVQISGDLAGAVLSYYLGVFNGNVDNSTLDAETDDDKEVAGRIFVQPFHRLRVAPLRNLGVGGGFTYGTRNGTAQNPNLLIVRSFGQSQIFSLSAATPVAGSPDPANTAVAAGTRVRWTVHGSYYFWRLGGLGEYVSGAHEVQKGTSSGNVSLSAWQLAASFLLTDDRASFTGVVPRRPFNPWHRGWGAMELAARYTGFQVDPGAFDNGLAAYSGESDRGFRSKVTACSGPK